MYGACKCAKIKVKFKHAKKVFSNGAALRRYDVCLCSGKAA